jgi:glucose 1-dehydrogenase
MTSPPPQMLKDQCAIVTGSSSGIGAAIAVAFAEVGAKVGINHRGDAAAADSLADRIRARGGDAVVIEGDVSREDDVSRMFSAFIDAFGRVDILVANAGIQRDAPVTSMTAEQWQTVIDVNLTGQFLCAREAIGYFLQQAPATTSKARGKIICMSSVHEVVPWAGHVNYAASKGGVMLLMKSLAQEVAAKKIRVNGIAPGAIKTKINEHVWSDPERTEKLLRSIPYGRIGEPEDIAQAALWLASDASDYVNGTTLFVDGGMTLMMGGHDSG